jgi:hypothetical protein
MINRTAKIIKCIVLSLFLCVSTFAQNKIAFVNGYAFYVEKSGIKKLTQAIVLTYDCDFISPGFIKEIDALKNEINDLKTQGKSIDEKVLELSKIEEVFKSFREKREESYKKRYSILIGPIEEKIKVKLNLFEKERGYTKIFDLSDDKVLETFLYLDESMDVTNEFIKFCNKEFEKEKTPNK